MESTMTSAEGVLQKWSLTDRLALAPSRMFYHSPYILSALNPKLKP